jgi:hypothetical protein
MAASAGSRCHFIMSDPNQLSAEVIRLLEDTRREQFWKLWGPYLSERQWGTVREDYSADGDAWKYFTHDDARSRAFRWGEDGLLGFSDRFGRLCFATALWNGRDPILKERLFGLSGPQGNHGEDVKELYYYLDSTPTHSYCKALYKYPQAEFPYERLIEENARRTHNDREFELADTGVFDGSAYFDVSTEYAKASIEDILIRIIVANRGAEAATIHVLPTLWYRNTWAWGAIKEECTTRPMIRADGETVVTANHAEMGEYQLAVAPGPDGRLPEFLFTENETNTEKLYGVPNGQPYVKDAFHDAVVKGLRDKVNPARVGTKVAAHYHLLIPAGGEVALELRLTNKREAKAEPFDAEYADTFELRRKEADVFYAERLGGDLSDEERMIARQAYAGLLWSKQFYNLVQVEWLNGDSTPPPPPAGHALRNADWDNLFNRDVLSMPDNWEYPYYCTWDLAFHTVSFSHIDPGFAKQQLGLFLREWYMHPNGQIPAYEWNFSDVNPPVHAWAAWRVYRLPWLLQKDDRKFLESVFQKLLLNFTWWVNRKDLDGNNLFAGGFLGLDNIGVFDRSKPLPTGGTLKQADGTAWMAFYCVQMLSIALELAQIDDVYEDLASKFFEHFVRIVHAMNELGGTGLWNEEDGFYYDMLEVDGSHEPLKVRSIVGFMPLLATTIIPRSYGTQCPEFAQRVKWFVRNHPLLVHHVVELNQPDQPGDRLLAVTTRERLARILRYMFDEEEFLSPFGIRSVSKCHAKNPYVYWAKGVAYSVDYEPGEGTTGMFGGNSNWRGPIWFPVNFLLIEALRTFHRFYGESFLVEFPTRSGNHVTLGEAARLLSDRLISLFRAGADGRRPCHGDDRRYADDPHWKDLLLFNEYFHADTGRGCGASHQTGWTALVTDLLNLKAHWEF